LNPQVVSVPLLFVFSSTFCCILCQNLFQFRTQCSNPYQMLSQQSKSFRCEPFVRIQLSYMFNKELFTRLISRLFHNYTRISSSKIHFECVAVPFVHNNPTSFLLLIIPLLYFVICCEYIDLASSIQTTQYHTVYFYFK
jgi:hypothetical protein